jgi:hypothetical protein
MGKLVITAGTQRATRFVATARKPQMPRHSHI